VQRRSERTSEDQLVTIYVELRQLLAKNDHHTGRNSQDLRAGGRLGRTRHPASVLQPGETCGNIPARARSGPRRARVYNIGTGLGIGLIELINTARAVTGREIAHASRTRLRTNRSVSYGRDSRTERSRLARDSFTAIGDLDRCLVGRKRLHRRSPLMSAAGSGTEPPSSSRPGEPPGCLPGSMQC
jgi:hypothetical protein